MSLASATRVWVSLARFLVLHDCSRRFEQPVRERSGGECTCWKVVFALSDWTAGSQVLCDAERRRQKLSFRAVLPPHILRRESGTG